MKKSVDRYIENASEDTRPIISHLRDLIGRAEPEIEENIKWNAPSFELDGKIICSIMAFKKHVNFMFSRGKQLVDAKDILVNIGEKSTMKGIKQILNIADLPDNEILTAYIQEAVQVSKKQ